jgi:ferric-dicitrate binding protein FerR (iron transport regulator)
MMEGNLKAPTHLVLRSGTIGPDVLEDLDPDVSLIAAYLSNELFEDDVKAVEERLVEDGDFFAKVYPLMVAWTLPTTPAHERQTRRSMAPMLRIAAGIIAAIGLSLFTWSITPDVAGVRNADTGRAPTSMMWRPRIVAATGGRKELEVPGGVRVSLDSGSTLTYDRVRLPMGEVRVALEGNGRLDVPSEEHVRLSTPLGETTLGAGLFDVHAEASTKELRITQVSTPLIK